MVDTIKEYPKLSAGIAFAKEHPKLTAGIAFTAWAANYVLVKTLTPKEIYQGYTIKTSDASSSFENKKLTANAFRQVSNSCPFLGSFVPLAAYALYARKWNADRFPSKIQSMGQIPKKDRETWALEQLQTAAKQKDSLNKVKTSTAKLIKKHHIRFELD